MAALTGEKVDIHLMKDPSLGGNHSLFLFDLKNKLIECNVNNENYLFFSFM
jgi:isopentenyldiphosphate isomerase